MEGGHDTLIHAAQTVAGEQARARRPRGQIIALSAVLATGLALSGLAAAIDGFIDDGGLRLLSSVILVLILGILLSLAAAIWSHEPDRWRHRFRPQRYTDGNFDRIAAAIGTEPLGAALFVPPGRVMAAAWVREVLAERLMVGPRLGPAQLRIALEQPGEAEIFHGKPAMRRFLEETRDLGVVKKGNILTATRMEFLRLAEAAMREAGEL
jgi:hypothetical protein